MRDGFTKGQMKTSFFLREIIDSKKAGKYYNYNVNKLL